MAGGKITAILRIILDFGEYYASYKERL